MLKKKLIVFHTAVIIGLGSTYAIPYTNAEEAKTIQTQIEKTDQELSKVQNELTSVIEYIDRVNQAIEDNHKKIEETRKEVTTTQQEVKDLEAEISLLEESVEKRTDILKERAISFQHSGGSVSYLDVLVGSSSFGDFINRVVAVGKIVQSDANLLEQHNSDLTELEEKKNTVNERLTELTNLQTELEGMQEHIKEQKEKNEEMKQLLEEEAVDKLLALRELQTKENTGSESEQTNVDQSSHSGESEPTSTNVPVPSENTQTSSGTIQDVIKAGYKYFGNSVYVFGGGRTASDIANGRFDCSGFVHWAFSTAGIRVGASTDSLKHEGRTVSVREMKAGDLVFFDTYKKDGHVGIYIGGGKFIGSQSSTGVAIADMSSGYWANVFNGRVKRVVH